LTPSADGSGRFNAAVNVGRQRRHDRASGRCREAGQSPDVVADVLLRGFRVGHARCTNPEPAHESGHPLLVCLGADWVSLSRGPRGSSIIVSGGAEAPGFPAFMSSRAAEHPQCGDGRCRAAARGWVVPKEPDVRASRTTREPRQRAQRHDDVYRSRVCPACPASFLVSGSFLVELGHPKSTKGVWENAVFRGTGGTSPPTMLLLSSPRRRRERIRDERGSAMREIMLRTRHPSPANLPRRAFLSRRDADFVPTSVHLNSVGCC
jgi:hypothetical protein